jgi:putative hydroxymethylpyrimidine transport system ATP-binding protein
MSTAACFAAVSINLSRINNSMNVPATTLAVTRMAWPGFVLENLHLHLPAGQTTCLLGPSGCGKTTLLRALGGLLPPCPAAAPLPPVPAPALPRRLAQRPAPALPQHQFTITPAPPLPVSYMAQQDALLPWASVLENVLTGPRLRQGRITVAQRAYALSLLQELEVAHLAAARPATLSGGQRQRVALARTLYETLHGDAPLVLLDEPFAALDFPTRWRLQAVAAQHLAGRTVLLVTHDPLEALRLGHHIVVLGNPPAARLLPCPVPPGPPPRSMADCALAQAALVALIAGENS